MTADQATVRARRSLVVVVGYVMRTALPPRRRALLLLPCAGAVLFGLLANVSSEIDRVEAFGNVVAIGLFGLVVPFACLVIGDAVLGAEVRDGTFALTWLSPVGFGAIVLGRWLGGWLLALVTIVPSLVLAAVAAGVPEAAGALVLAGVFGTAAYVALFVLIGATARRAAMWSITFLILVERLLGAALTGVAQLCPGWLGIAAYEGLGPAGTDLERDGMPEGSSAVVRLAVVTVLSLALAVWRVRHLRLAGSDD